MQEAFRKALDDVHSQPTAHADTSYLDVLRVTVGTPSDESQDMTLDKLAYRLEKLARHVRTYIEPGMTTTARRAQLQDDWLPLVLRLGRLGADEQVSLLELYARGILACPPSRIRTY